MLEKIGLLLYGAAAMEAFHLNPLVPVSVWSAFILFAAAVGIDVYLKWGKPRNEKSPDHF